MTVKCSSSDSCRSSISCLAGIASQKPWHSPSYAETTQTLRGSFERQRRHLRYLILASSWSTSTTSMTSSFSTWQSLLVIEAIGCTGPVSMNGLTSDVRYLICEIHDTFLVDVEAESCSSQSLLSNEKGANHVTALPPSRRLTSLVSTLTRFSWNGRPTVSSAFLAHNDGDVSRGEMITFTLAGIVRIVSLCYVDAYLFWRTYHSNWHTVDSTSRAATAPI